MDSRFLVLPVLIAVTTAVFAQDKPKIKRTGQGKASAAILKARAVAEVRSSAAAVRFAAIKLTLASMLAEFQSKHSLTAAAEDETMAEVYQTGEDEILRQIAVQLEDFIKTYPTTNEAEAARAILARVYIRLQRVEDAARVVQTFDAENATAEAILQIALASPEIAAVAKRVAPMLEAAVVSTDDAAQQVDAVFVAMRLGLKTEAVELLAKIHKAAKTVEAKAAVLLAEAQLVARLVRPIQVPVTRSATVRNFVVSPLSTQLMSPNQTPVHRWAQVAAVDDATFVRTKPVDGDDTGTVDAATQAGMRAAAVARLEFAKSPLYDAISDHARPGIRALHAWSRLTGSAAPIPVVGLDTELPMTGDAVVLGLLHRLIQQYPGTRAADIAIARLHAESVSRGQLPVPIEGTSIDGQPVSLAKRSAEHKVVLVDFWSTGDPQSVVQRPALAELYDNFRARGFDIISVNLDSAADEWLVRTAIAHFKMDWAVIYEGMGSHSRIAQSWGIDVLPARVLIGSDGTIFEDRPENLTPERLPAVVQEALRARLADLEIGAADPRMRSPDPAVVDVEVDPELPRMMVAPPPFGDWRFGPQITVDLEIMESQPLQYAIVARTHVMRAGYAFVHEKTRTADGNTEVYLSLIAPDADALSDARVTYRPIEVRVNLGATVGRSVRVFARRTIKDAHYIVDPEYRMISVQPILQHSRLRYVGPEIQTEIVEPNDGSGGEIIICRVQVPNPDYVFALDKIRSRGNVTQVLLKLHAPVATEDIGKTQVKKIRVNLGAREVGTVEVLVDFRGTSEARDPSYALATTLKDG